MNSDETRVVRRGSHVVHRFRESTDAFHAHSLIPLFQALKSTAVTHSAYIPRFLPDGRDALVVAKGNVLEVWRGSEDGLVEEEAGKTEVWGMVVGMEWVGGEVSVCLVSAMCEGLGRRKGAVVKRSGTKSVFLHTFWTARENWTTCFAKTG